MGIIRGFNQLHVYAHRVSTFLHAAFQNVGNAKLFGDLRQIFRGAFIMLRGCTRDYLEIAYLGQARQDFILNTFRKIRIRLVFAQILKRQHRDALFRRSQCHLSPVGKYHHPSDNCRKYEQRCRHCRPAHSRPTFLCGQFQRELPVAELIGPEVHNPNAHSMFYFERTKIMQERSPFFVMFKIFSDALREQNVACIAAIHHSLRDVHSSAREVRSLVHIHHSAYRAAMHSHPNWQPWMLRNRLANLHRTLHRSLRSCVKYQRHAVAGGDLEQTTRGLRLLKFSGCANNTI